MASAASEGSPITFMPRPPPPWAALTATGQPWAAPKASTWSGPVIGSAVPGTPGTPAPSAARREEILSPMISMASGPGPTKTAPLSATERAKPAFSLRNPYPG